MSWYAQRNKGGDKVRRLFSPGFWISTFISTFVTMLFIYWIKILSAKFNIPVVSKVAEAV